MFLGCNAVLPSDCTADLNESRHQSAIERIDLFFGWVCSSNELEPLLEGHAAAPFETQRPP